jgi:outer membrane protein TolC
MRSFVGLTLLLLLARPAAAVGDPLTLAQVLADVRARHPEIGSAAATAAGDRERVVQSGAWEDPVAGLELQRMNNNTRLFSYDQAEVSLSQKIPLSGNLARRRAAAQAEAGVSAAAVRTRTFMVLASAREAYFALLRTREQLALVAASERLLVQAADLVRSRLATGGTDTSALLMAERERAQLQERLILLEREAADAAATLNVLRDLPPQAPVGELVAPPLTSGDAFATLAAAQAHALAHRPELGEAEARITAASRAVDVAARAWRPDPEVMVKARHVQAGGRAVNDYDTGFALSLPWANNDKYRAAQREAARRREAAELDAAALRTRTAGEIREMWTRRDTARRNVELYRDRLLPLARAGADALRAGLVTGKNSLAELVAAQRALVEAEITLAANLADFHRYHAMLATLTGAADPS